MSNPGYQPPVITTPIKEDLVSRKIRQFKELSDFLSEWFYKPDMDAVKICLSTYASHSYMSDDPVWLFIIGVSGSGKTSIAIRSVGFLPDCHEVNDITTNGFLSGYGEGNGILGKLTKKHNGNGVLLFPDFTSILSMPIVEREKIVGQLRRIYDGKFSKTIGNKDDNVSWEGKVSVLAATTPALEDYWMVNRNLGERFMYLRWKSGNPQETARYAKKQVGNKRFIHENFKRLVLDFTDLPFNSVDMPADEDLGLDGIADMVSKLRCAVKREIQGSKRIVSGVDEPELPTRISQSLAMIARGSATLDRRAKIDLYDLFLAKRVAMDSVPKNRRILMNILFADQNYEQSIDELQRKAGLADSVFDRCLEDLRLLDGIVITQGVNYKWATVTQGMIKAWEDTYVVKIDQ